MGINIMKSFRQNTTNLLDDVVVKAKEIKEKVAKEREDKAKKSN
jgi:hypothetical protein